MTRRENRNDLPGFLRTLADTLCAPGEEELVPSLMYVSVSGDEFEVGTKPLDGLAPCEALVGSVAPEEWLALGVASGGWARALDGGGRPGKRTGRVRSAVFVTRPGEVVAVCRTGDRVITEAPAYGLTLDCLQRAFDLPTAAPLAGTGEFFASMWIEEVMRVAAEFRIKRQRLSLSEIIDLHPAARVLATGDDAWRVSSSQIEQAAKKFESVCDWERLRWLVVEGWPARNLSPSEAAWFDAGSFSRWSMSQQCSIPWMLDQLIPYLEPSVFKRFARCLSRMGFPGPSNRPGEHSNSPLVGT